MTRAARRTIVIAGLAFLVVAAVVARLSVGSSMGLPHDESTWREVINLRAVSAASAVIVGVCLATSGVFLQSLLRNPLASPYILGLAGGAGVGIALTRWLGAASAPSIDLGAPGSNTAFWIEQFGALAGALAAISVVYALSQRRGRVDPMSLLLVGVMASAICGALIMLIQHLSAARDNDQLIRWMMGSIRQSTSWHALLTAGAIASAGVITGLLLARAMDAAALSDDEARSVGVPLDRLRLVLFIMAGAMTASAVVIAGPIGFVGLIAPHISRRLVGASHAGVVVSSALVGAALLLLADTGVQAAHLLDRSRGLMPVGIVTTAIGGPLFIWMLRRQRARIDRP